MSTVAEIEAAIEQLPPDDQRQLRRWVIEHVLVEDNEDILAPSSYRQKILDGLDQP
jgi:hypothetical protein